MSTTPMSVDPGLYKRNPALTMQRLCADLDDDSMPLGYPNLHFGESVFAGFAGSPIEFTGNGLYTWAGTRSPPIHTWDDLEEVLTMPLQEPWRSGFASMAKCAVRRAAGHFGLRTFITIDTLNLAVEWRGGTAAYLDLADCPDHLLRIFPVSRTKSLKTSPFTSTALVTSSLKASRERL